MSAPAASAATGNRWIVSRRQDLIWFQGSVLAGAALLLAFRALPPLGPDATVGHPALWVLLAWGVLFDGTHVFGTYARSYLAPRSDLAARQGLPPRAAWALLAIGPAVAVVDHALFAPGPSVVGQAGPLFRWFLLGAYLWAYWHLVRQHYGFLVLYRRKGGDDGERNAREPTSFARRVPSRGVWDPLRVLTSSVRLDAAVLWAGCLFPFVRYSLGPAYAASGLPVLLPPGPSAALRASLDVAAFAAAAVLVMGAFLSWSRPAPKHLLLAIVIAFHVVTFALLDNLLEITATLTIFHNLQYHRIVWQHERGRARTPVGGLLDYLGLGIALGLAWYGPRVLGVAVAPSDLARNVLIGLGWGVAFHHYLVDGRIWRVRRAPAVARALDVGAAA